LYGVNPRGKAPYIGSENILKNGSNFTTIRNFFNTAVNVSNPENLYPGYTETTNIRYYHSTNLGIRYVPAAIAAANFTATSNILPNDGIRYNRYLFASSSTTNGLTYINNSGGVVSSDILLFTQTIDGAHYTTSFNGNSYQLPRFSGYYDFGIMEFSNTENKFNFNSDVGFYIKEAILNNFANTGFNWLRTSLLGDIIREIVRASCTFEKIFCNCINVVISNPVKLNNTPIINSVDDMCVEFENCTNI
jgi:hypothetical protein